MPSGLLVERHGPVGWLIFDRPDHGNAFDADVLAALPGACAGWPPTRPYG